MKIEDFVQPKKDLSEEWVELGVLIHEVLDNGVPLKDVLDYVDMVYHGNMELMWFEFNGRMND